MARARNIKPGFFANENLAECDPLARLLFAGLWCLADRAGRLEDRPKRIRAELLPYDMCDADGLLEQLQKHGFIARYEVDGTRFIQVLNFDKHQNPHMKEAKSTIPAPAGFGADSGEELNSSGDKFNKHQTSTVRAPEKHQTSPADSGFSESLIPDSLIEEANASLSIAAANDETDRTTPPCPHGELLAIFAEELPTLPQPRAEAWTGARAKSLSCRWKWVLTAKKPSGQRYATTKAEGLDFFRRYFGYVATCPHLVGKNSRGWTADLGWLSNETNFSKVIDGNYDQKELETA